jgi:hypothetical protein
VVKKSFLWMTFLTPVLMAALIVVPIWLASIKDDEERVVAVVDQTGLYKEFFEGLRNEECRFEVIKSMVDGQQSTDFNPLPFGTPPKAGGESWSCPSCERRTGGEWL